MKDQLVRWIVYLATLLLPLDLQAEEPVEVRRPGEDSAVPGASPPGKTGPPGGGPGLDNPLAALLNPVVGQLRPAVSYGLRLYPEADLVNQPGELGWHQHEVNGQSPLWQDDEHEFYLTAGARATFFQGEAPLPDGRGPLPDELWNLRLGLGSRVDLGEGWLASGQVSVGSASDQPFHGGEEMIVNLVGALRIPHNDYGAWLFSIYYSPTSELWFPIPGVAYLWQPDARLTVLAGIPLALIYRPTDELTWSFFYLPVRNIRSEVAWRPLPWVRLHGGYEWCNDSYLLADRPDERARLFFYEQRLTAGVQVFCSKNCLVDLHGGWSFDRFYFEGRRFGDRSLNQVDLQNAPFAGARVAWRW